MNLEFSNEAKETLQKFRKSNPIAAKQIVQQIQKLVQNPNKPNVCKVAGGKESEMRATAGAHRIIYCLRDEGYTLFIKLIGKRNDDEIYRRRRRLLQ